jgi:hypothetical protein
MPFFSVADTESNNAENCNQFVVRDSSIFLIARREEDA